MSSDSKQNTGKSCLVCRRRKVKCDKTKPVCQTCIKHRSEEHCRYEGKANIRFQHIVFGGRTNTSSSGLLSPEERIRSVSSKETSLIDSKTVENTTVPNATIPNDTPNATILPSCVKAQEPDLQIPSLRQFDDMSFNEGRDAIEVKAGRLSFAGPLHFVALSRRDPFLNVMTVLIRNQRFENHEKMGKNQPRVTLKYPDVTYTQAEIADQLILNTEDKVSSPSPKDGQRVNHSLQKGAGNQKESGDDASSGSKAVEVEDTSRAADIRFQRKLIENEGLDEIDTDDQKDELSYNPLSVVNLLNSESKTIQELPETATEAKNDILIWRKMQVLLDTLKRRKTDEEKKCIANERVPEMLFSNYAHGSPSQEYIVLQKIQSILPSDKIIWIHVDNYFASPLHGLFPVLNEDWFKDTIRKLIGERIDSDTKPAIRITKRFDMSKVASLLIVLRLSFLTYPEHIGNCVTEEEKLIVSNPIGIEFVNVAQMCLNQFKMLRKAVLPVLHCAIMLRLYRRFAPEEGDIADGGDSEPFSGLLVRMATSIGLNTEAETSSQLSDNYMYLQSWRKCWYVIYFLDLYEGMNMGNSLMIDENSFSTKLPTLDYNENGEYPSYVTNVGLESASLSCLQNNFQFSLQCRKLLQIVVNKRFKTNCQLVEDTARNLETLLRDSYGDGLKRIVSLPCDTIKGAVTKCNNFVTFINTLSVLAMVYYHLHLHLDNQVEKSRSASEASFPIFYLKKLLRLYVEIEPVLVVLFYGCRSSQDKRDIVDEMFGKHSKMVILQSCGVFIVRFTVILRCLISKFQHFKYNHIKEFSSKSSLDVAGVTAVVNEIITVTLAKFQAINKMTHVLSKTHFYAWRMSKGNTYIYNLLKDESNCVFDSESPIMARYRKMSYRDAKAGTHHDHSPNSLNPWEVFPKFNTLVFSKVQDFDNILSILNSTDWYIFSNTLTEIEINSALRALGDYSELTTKNGTRRLKIRKSLDPENATVKLRNIEQSDISPQDLSDCPSATSNNTIPSSCSPSKEGNNGVTEIDAFWYQTKLRNANDNNWVAGLPARNIDYAIANDHNQSAVAGISHSEDNFNNVGLDELFHNQELLQEHVMRQLHELTKDGLSSDDLGGRRKKRRRMPEQDLSGPTEQRLHYPDIFALNTLDVFMPFENPYDDELDLN